VVTAQDSISLWRKELQGTRKYIYGSTFFMALTPAADFRLPRFVLSISELFRTRRLNKNLLQSGIITNSLLPTQLKTSWRKDSISMADRSKAWVCGGSLDGIAGSNTAESMAVCLLWVFCVVGYRSVLLADHLSRGVLPSVCVCVCDWVWSSATITLYTYNE